MAVAEIRFGRPCRRSDPSASIATPLIGTFINGDGLAATSALQSGRFESLYLAGLWGEHNAQGAPHLPVARWPSAALHPCASTPYDIVHTQLLRAWAPPPCDCAGA
ncbi:MAG: hypothetical protein QOD87_1225 [Pseudonocardiales bacterium]|nr:hypothetical protein [Pseudonocardiales bacterium]